MSVFELGIAMVAMCPGLSLVFDFFSPVMSCMVGAIYKKRISYINVACKFAAANIINEFAEKTGKKGNICLAKLSGHPVFFRPFDK